MILSRFQAHPNRRLSPFFFFFLEKKTQNSVSVYLVIRVFIGCRSYTLDQLEDSFFFFSTRRFLTGGLLRANSFSIYFNLSPAVLDDSYFLPAF